MSSLAGMLFCDASNVTGIVDRLEARGLIERRPAAQDRRVKLLALTPAGEQVRATVPPDDPAAARDRRAAARAPARPARRAARRLRAGGVGEPGARGLVT